jgi:hypothetical protein
VVTLKRTILFNIVYTDGVTSVDGLLDYMLAHLYNLKQTPQANNVHLHTTSEFIRRNMGIWEYEFSKLQGIERVEVSTFICLPRLSDQ